MLQELFLLRTHYWHVLANFETYAIFHNRRICILSTTYSAFAMPLGRAAHVENQTDQTNLNTQHEYRRKRCRNDPPAPFSNEH